MPYVEEYSIEDNSKNIIFILRCVEKFESDESVSNTYSILLESEFYFIASTVQYSKCG